MLIWLVCWFFVLTLAHASKIKLRFDNIARIQSELRVDTFLPPDDPRNQLKDITAKFDHVFWCGDLNCMCRTDAVRVDITRKHADWLIQNKSYDHALAFDQLKKSMAEGLIFQNFREAHINFPPTYKFDILSAIALRHAQTHDDENYESRTDPHVVPQPNRPFWRRFIRRKSRESIDPTERNAATLVRSPSNESLSNVSESSSIMEAATEALEHKPSLTSLTSGTTEKPMDAHLMASVRQQVLNRKASIENSLRAGRATYDSSSKQRVPSWCDRVLWRSNVMHPAPQKRRGDFLRRHAELPTRSDEDATKRNFVQAPFHWLQSRTSSSDGTTNQSVFGPVTVLEYRSIDDMDAEDMGTVSDHRPVFFGAAIRL